MHTIAAKVRDARTWGRKVRNMESEDECYHGRDLRDAEGRGEERQPMRQPNHDSVALSRAHGHADLTRRHTTGRSTCPRSNRVA
eukprot:5313570-Prymnesium_polylepis.3